MNAILAASAEILKFETALLLLVTAGLLVREPAASSSGDGFRLTPAGDAPG